MSQYINYDSKPYSQNYKYSYENVLGKRPQSRSSIPQFKPSLDSTPSLSQQTPSQFHVQTPQQFEEIPNQSIKFTSLHPTSISTRKKLWNENFYRNQEVKNVMLQLESYQIKEKLTQSKMLEVKTQNSFLVNRNKELEKKVATLQIKLKFSANKSDKKGMPLQFSKEKFLEEKNETLQRQLSTIKKEMLEKVNTTEIKNQELEVKIRMNTEKYELKEAKRVIDQLQMTILSLKNQIKKNSYKHSEEYALISRDKREIVKQKKEYDSLISLIKDKLQISNSVNQTQKKELLMLKKEINDQAHNFHTVYKNEQNNFQYTENETRAQLSAFKKEYDILIKDYDLMSYQFEDSMQQLRENKKLSEDKSLEDQEQVAQIQIVCDKLREKVSQLKQQKELLNEQRSQQQDKNGQIDIENHKLSLHIENIKEQKGKLIGQLNEEVILTKELTMQKKILLQESKENSNKIIQYKQLIHQLTNDIQQVQSHNEEVHQKNLSLQDNLERKDQLERELSQENEKISYKKDQYETQNQDLFIKNQNLQGVINILEEKNVKNQMKIQESTIRHSNECLRFKEDLIRANQENQQIIDQNIMMTNEIQKAVVSYKELEQTIEELREDNQRLSEEKKNQIQELVQKQQKSLNSLNEINEHKVAQLVLEYEEKVKEEQNQRQNQLQNQQEQLISKHELDIQRISSENSSNLKEILHSNKETSLKQLSDEKQEHDNIVQEMKAKSEENEANFRNQHIDLRSQHSNQQEKMKSDYENLLSKLKDTHETLLKQQRIDFESKISHILEESHTKYMLLKEENLNNEIDLKKNNSQMIEEMRFKYEEKISQLKEKRESAIERLKEEQEQQIKDLKEENRVKIEEITAKYKQIIEQDIQQTETKIQELNQIISNQAQTLSANSEEMLDLTKNLDFLKQKCQEQELFMQQREQEFELTIQEQNHINQQNKEEFEGKIQEQFLESDALKEGIKQLEEIKISLEQEIERLVVVEKEHFELKERSKQMEIEFNTESKSQTEQIYQLQELIKSKDQLKVQLESQLEKLTTYNQTLRSENDRINKEGISLKKQVADEFQSNKDSQLKTQAVLSEKQNEIYNLKRQIDSLENDQQALCEKYKTFSESVEKETINNAKERDRKEKEHTVLVKDHEQLVEKNKNQVIQFESKIRSLSNQIEDLVIQNSALEEQIQANQQIIQTTKEQTSSMTKDLTEKSQECQKLSQCVETHVSGNKKLIQLNRDLENKYRVVKLQNMEQDQIYDKLQYDITKMRKSMRNISEIKSPRKLTQFSLGQEFNTAYQQQSPSLRESLMQESLEQENQDLKQETMKLKQDLVTSAQNLNMEFSPPKYLTQKTFYIQFQNLLNRIKEANTMIRTLRDNISIEINKELLEISVVEIYEEIQGIQAQAEKIFSEINE